jgi:PIN domain nuclease of toxin-antitoxin system
VRLLLDTHVLLWSSESPERLSEAVRELLDRPETEVYFSVVSLWEIGIKRALKRPDFQFEPRVLRKELLAHGYHELPVLAEHTLAIERLPGLHRDPFDRLLLCQALVEDLTVMTNDELLIQYPFAVRRV